MRYITRPLTDEARLRLRGVVRENARFDSPWTSTLRLLDRELTQLGVRNEFVLQIDVQESDLRLDGELRANAKPASPSVAVAFKSGKNDLLFVCGRFWRWQDNVRAIALGLEALRKVERYGIVQSDEQYRGFQALPPGTPMPAAQMTKDGALEVLRRAALWESGPDYDSPEQILLAFRAAAMRSHPDVGGDPDAFRRVVEARDLLLA